MYILNIMDLSRCISTKTTLKAFCKSKIYIFKLIITLHRKYKLVNNANGLCKAFKDQNLNT